MSILIFGCVSLNCIWKIWSNLYFQNLDGRTIYKDAPMAQAFRESFWKMFYKQKIMKIRNETVKESVKKK